MMFVVTQVEVSACIITNIMLGNGHTLFKIICLKYIWYYGQLQLCGLSCYFRCFVNTLDINLTNQFNASRYRVRWSSL